MLHQWRRLSCSNDARNLTGKQLRSAACSIPTVHDSQCNSPLGVGREAQGAELRAGQVLGSGAAEARRLHPRRR